MDPEILASIETARAAWQVRTSAPDYVAPEPYKSVTRPKPTPKKEAMTVERAFTLLLKANAVLMRARDPVSAAAVWAVWEDYKWAYAHWHNVRLPAEKLADFGLSILQLRDLFGDTTNYIQKRNYARSKPEGRRVGGMQSFGAILSSASTPVEKKSNAEPFSLMLINAEKKAAATIAAKTTKQNALNFLSRNGYLDLESQDEYELRRLRDAEINARKYPRTYL